MQDAYGRRKLHRTKQAQGLRYIPIFYCSCALEWINLQQIFSELLSHFGVLEQVALDNISFSWIYDRNIASKVYKPSDVFKYFSFINLLDENATCIYLTDLDLFLIQ